MKNRIQEPVVFDDNMYKYPQSHLSRKYEFICITPDMLQEGINFDKFCKCIGGRDYPFSTTLRLNDNENLPLMHGEIKILFDYISDYDYKRNPNLQLDFWDFLKQTVEPFHLLEVPWGGKRKQYFNG